MGRPDNDSIIRYVKRSQSQRSHYVLIKDVYDVKGISFFLSLIIYSG